MKEAATGAGGVGQPKWGWNLHKNGRALCSLAQLFCERERKNENGTDSSRRREFANCACLRRLMSAQFLLALSRCPTACNPEPLRRAAADDDGRNFLA